MASRSRYMSSTTGSITSRMRIRTTTSPASGNTRSCGARTIAPMPWSPITGWPICTASRRTCGAQSSEAMSEEPLDPLTDAGSPRAADGAPVDSAATDHRAENGPVVGRRRWIAAAAAAVGVALFAVPFLRGPADEPDRAGPLRVTAGAPGATCAAKNTANFNFTLKDSNGASVRLADYQGKVVLLNFWATWCG